MSSLKRKYDEPGTSTKCSMGTSVDFYLNDLLGGEHYESTPENVDLPLTEPSTSKSPKRIHVYPSAKAFLEKQQSVTKMSTPGPDEDQHVPVTATVNFDRKSGCLQENSANCQATLGREEVAECGELAESEEVVESDGANEPRKKADDNIIRVFKNSVNTVARMSGKAGGSNANWFPISWNNLDNSFTGYKISDFTVKLKTPEPETMESEATQWSEEKNLCDQKKWNEAKRLREEKKLCEKGKLSKEKKLREAEKLIELCKDFRPKNVAEIFSGLVGVKIQLEKDGTKSESIIQFITERELTEEEIKEMKAHDMVAKRKGKTTDLKLILVEDFSYKFDSPDVPTDLFHSQVGRKPELRKILKLELGKFEPRHKEFTINVNFSSAAIVGDSKYVESAGLDMKELIPILNYFFKANKRQNIFKAHPSLRKSDAERFFSLTKFFQEREPFPENSSQPKELFPRLKNYQRDAVIWMMHRERALTAYDPQESERLKHALQRRMYIPVQLTEIGLNKQSRAFYCLTSGEICSERESTPDLPSGGILADEIGLGKTFETLCLILLNKRAGFESAIVDSTVHQEKEIDCPGTPPAQGFKNKEFECHCKPKVPGNAGVKIVTCTKCKASHHATCFGYEFEDKDMKKKYVCPTCVSRNPPVPAKTTLIVVPASILQQWKDEIDHNIAGIHVLIYEGVKSKNYQPVVVLAQHDIVLTTYQILDAEIPYAELALQDLENTRQFRNPKQYAALPSPLVSVGWWRICLDEAQISINMKSSMKKLARGLQAEHRWCITGTPIQNSIQDLYGLVTFLGVEPICSKSVWNTLIIEPFQNGETAAELITPLFGQIFWRNEKEDVKAELRLPRQTEVIHRLELSPVEKVLYAERFRQLSSKLDLSSESIPIPSHYENADDFDACFLDQAAQATIEKMRQICCHPQLEDSRTVKLVKRSTTGGMEPTITLREMLKRLLNDAIIVCTANYLEFVTALNALARLHLQVGEGKIATEYYWRVIDLAEKYKDELNTQDVQKLLAARQLVLDEVSLQVKVEETEAILLEKETTSLAIYSSNINHLNDDIVDRIRESGLTPEKHWWIKVLNAVQKTEHGSKSVEEYFCRIKRSVSVDAVEFSLESGAAYTVETFLTPDALFQKLHIQFKKIIKSRHELKTSWEAVNSEDIKLTLANVTTCKFSQPGEPECTVCEFRKRLDDFEKVLFRYCQKEIVERRPAVEKHKPWSHIPDIINQQSHLNKSITEIILVETLKCAKEMKLPETLNYIDHVKVFKQMRWLFWLFQDWLFEKEAQLSNLESILQATTPVARINAENSQNLPYDHILERITQEQSGLNAKDLKFQKSLAHLLYLKMLQNNEFGGVGYSNPDLCPCSKTLGQKWGFLPCGHCICDDCCGDKEETKSSDCSMCNLRFQYTDILFVDTKSPRHTVTEPSPWPALTLTAPETVKGEHFTKIDAVIRVLLKLKETHEFSREKVLLVSSWQPILKVLAFALEQNDITFTNYITTGAPSRQALIEFRTNPNQVLLMPLEVASTGLNLTESNHIFIVEPILNLSLEKQAIGRIHRLGQKRETFVHRFYVAGTIEETLHERRQMKDVNDSTEANAYSENSNLTVGDLRKLIGS